VGEEVEDLEWAAAFQDELSRAGCGCMSRLGIWSGVKIWKRGVGLSPLWVWNAGCLDRVLDDIML